MTKIYVPPLILLLVATGFFLVAHQHGIVYAEQQAGSPRLTVMPAGVLDSAKGGIRAAFVRDTKTGECWLWINESSAGSALSPASTSACVDR